MLIVLAKVALTAVLMPSASVFTGSASLVLCFAHESWFAAVCVPSSGGGDELYPLMLCEVYGLTDVFPMTHLLYGMYGTHGGRAGLF